MRTKPILSALLAALLLVCLCLPISADDSTLQAVSITGSEDFVLTPEVAAAYWMTVQEATEIVGKPYTGPDDYFFNVPIWYGTCGGYLANISSDQVPELILLTSKQFDDLPLTEITVYTWDGTQVIAGAHLSLRINDDGTSWKEYSLRQTETGTVLEERTMQVVSESEPAANYWGLQTTGSGADFTAELAQVGAILSEDDPTYLLGACNYILMNNYDTLLEALETVADEDDAILLTSGTPSDWARAEVGAAVAKHLVPGVLLRSYQNPITREEFCTLIVQTLSQIYGDDFVEFLEENGQLQHNIFTDTDRSEILAANALGIVNGRGDGTFDPDASITRQEAAAMLTRTARDNLELTAGEPLVFTDADLFAKWAVDSISYVSGLLDPYNLFHVMGGMGDGSFGPLGWYTREQAMCTVLRLYENWEMKTIDPESYASINN